MSNDSFPPNCSLGPFLRKELPGERMLMQRLRGPSFQKALSVTFLRSILTEPRALGGGGGTPEASLFPTSIFGEWTTLGLTGLWRPLSGPFPSRPGVLNVKTK